MVVITIVRWGYKPTYNVWGPHLVWLPFPVTGGKNDLIFFYPHYAYGTQPARLAKKAAGLKKLSIDSWKISEKTHRLLILDNLHSGNLTVCY